LEKQNFIEKCISSKRVFSGVLLDVFSDEVVLPNGRKSIREYIRHPGAALAIPYLGDREIVLIRQFRYPVGRVMIELPAGKLDPGEDTETTIRREIVEETGLEAGILVKLSMIHTCVGYSSEFIDLFWASELVQQFTNLDSDENIETFQVSIEEAIEMIYTGEITDAKTIIGLFWAEKILNDENLRARFNIKI
jgi:ADP-ribose pyrophosphatase